jgi:Ca2+-binding EF-hand superfamily protein
LLRNPSIMKPHLAAVAALLWTATVFAQNHTVPTEKIDAAFSKIDRDQNGTLDPEEAKAFGITTEAFNIGNQDGDGTLDKQEFAAAVSYQFAAADPGKKGALDWNGAQKAGINNRKIFDAANANHDGTLDVAEYLAAMLAQSQQPGSPASRQPTKSR